MKKIALIIILLIVIGLSGCDFFKKDSTGKSDIKDVKWNYIYENLSKKVPVYKTIDKVRKEPVYKSVCDIVYNATSKNESEVCVSVIDYYKDVKYKEKELVGYKTEYYNGKRKGLKVGDKTINHPNVNVKDNKLIEWTYPIGDRNFEEFGTCREYEKQKGMCKETSILELVSLK